eukprot:CAMPEP_0198137698 /NCGR_PEP_ID=MMETSP1443-20131203/1157_1 /TAXON_ID=186043 /ORGANISM="Entomoneis sp., Strain CCMP2396" /LENGTH=417 /DNA_ID=CAMNT_0043799211 /DNA_START=149 /DNA_END=1402 /DNA_ORIENTATION=-
MKTSIKHREKGGAYTRRQSGRSTQQQRWRALAGGLLLLGVFGFGYHLAHYQKYDDIALVQSLASDLSALKNPVIKSIIDDSGHGSQVTADKQVLKLPPAPAPPADGDAATTIGDIPSITRLLQEGLPSTVKIHKLSDNLEKCDNTMVTGYFRLKSKYPADNYLKWMENMLSVQDCMVIFTSTDAMEPIKKFRKGALSKTVLIELTLDDLPISKMGVEFWKHQLDIDREKRRHVSYQLFWIWLSKSWCVVQAIRQNYFQNDPLHGVFMWQDIGSYRNKQYNGKLIMEHADIIPPKTLLWLAHHPVNPPPTPIWNDKYSHKEHYFHSGSQGAGEAQAWLEYHTKFGETLQKFLDSNGGMYIGEDQCVLQSTCQQYPDLCAYVQNTDIKDNHYFGLRYALTRGGEYNLWRFPPVVADAST